VPASNSTGTAWTALDGNPLGVLSYRWTPPSGPKSFTVRRPPAVIMARTCNQFRTNEGSLPPWLRCTPVPSAKVEVVPLRTMPCRFRDTAPGFTCWPKAATE
jgi:hypothetical protein